MQDKTLRSGQPGGAMSIQYNKYRPRRKHCMGAQRRGNPNLGWGGVGQGSVSGTVPFTES